MRTAMSRLLVESRTLAECAHRLQAALKRADKLFDERNAAGALGRLEGAVKGVLQQLVAILPDDFDPDDDAGDRDRERAADEVERS